MRLVQTIVNADNSRRARVYRNGNWNEYVVRFYVNGQHQDGADYHDDDREECAKTAWKWCFPDVPD